MGLITPLQIALSLLCLLIAVDLLVRLVRNRRASNLELNALLVVESGLLVQLIAGLFALGDAPAGMSTWVWVGYLVGALVIIPAAIVWSAGDQSRGGTGVLLAAALVVPFLLLRLQQIWSVHG